MMISETGYHLPVLFHSSLTWLNIKPEGTYVDVTFGGGGHSRGILQQLGTEGRLFAFDQDPDAWTQAPEDSRLTRIPFRFDQLSQQLLAHGVTQVDGILADLGISSHQIDTPERGFSYRFDAPLDMRMDTSKGKTASQLLESWDTQALSKILSQYADFYPAHPIADAMVRYRNQKGINTTRDLKEALQSVIPRNNPSGFLSRVFQAIRIAVNEEMEALDDLLLQSLDMLATEGRMVVISYHSLEDRKVKHFFRSGDFTGSEEKDLYGNSLSPWKVLTRQAIKPTSLEIQENPRARSARLRAAARRNRNEL